MAPPRATFSDLYNATYGSDAAGGKATLVTASLRDASDEEDTTGQDVELWGVAPVLYVPADPTDDGACQGLTVAAGRGQACIATRDLRAARAVPGLQRGDAAFVCPTGRSGIVAKPDGSIFFVQRGAKEGDPDTFFGLTADGELMFAGKHGNLVLGKDGFQVITADATALGLGEGDFTVTAVTANLAAHNIGLGIKATVPLCATPTAPTGFCSQVPVAHIFVPAVPAS